MHVFVRIAGHGLRFLPTPPFGIQQGDDDAISVTVEDSEGVETSATIDAAPPSDARQTAVGPVLPGPAGAYRIEVGGVYQVSWPAELALVSAPEPEEPPFFMFSAGDGALLYVQGPLAREDLPPLEEMVGEDQEVLEVDQDAETPYVELGYEHGGQRWRQRHMVRPFGDDAYVVLTTQAREDDAAMVSALAGRIAPTIVPYLDN